MYNAIKSVVGRPNDLTGFSVRSVTDGQTALGEVTIKVTPAESGSSGRRDVRGLARVATADMGSIEVLDGTAASERDSEPPSFSGTATDKDIIMGAAQAYLAALNRLLAADKSESIVSGAGVGGGV